MDRRVGVLALLVAVVAGLGSVALTQTGPSAEPRGLAPSDAPVMGLLVGWSFAGAGVVASVLRPQNRFGVLLYGTGLSLGAALALTPRRRWLGGIAAVAGSGLVAVAVITAHAGFSHGATALMLPTTAALSVFTAGVAAVAWRRTDA